LGDWQGYLQADGYQVYHGLGDGIKVVGCLAHVRRYFTDIVKATVKIPSTMTTATEAVKRLDDIFRVERSFADMTPDQRFEHRLYELKPLTDDFFNWMDSLLSKVTPGYSLGKAVKYALGQRQYVENVFLDGRLALTNNRAERAIRPFAIGRRNFLFSDTPKGAKASAILFSIVQTVLENKLIPFEYLIWVLTELPNTDLAKDPDAINCFLPYSDTIPAHIRQRPDELFTIDEDAYVVLPEGMDIEEYDRTVRQIVELSEQN
jgi:transposase